MTENTAAIKAAVEALTADFEMKADFVPFSQSRNRDHKYASLNWRICLYRNGKVVLGPVDFSQGTGHCPAYKAEKQQIAGVSAKEAARWECENGRTYVFGDRGAKLPAPEKTDVLRCLVSDTDVLNYAGFEDWAINYGYDPDSRSAEQTYDACLKLSLALKAAIGAELLEKLREALTDY